MYPNEDILFTDCQWGKSLDYLNNILYHPENIILVSGIPGTGKTTLKYEIIKHLPNSFKIFTTSGDPSNTVYSFMQQIYLGFGLVWDNHVDWEEFRRVVFNQANYNWLLLIDDAEQLTWDILNSLIDLYILLSSDSNNFNIVLFANNSLLNSINASTLKDFFAVKFKTIHLSSLTLAEMTNFLHNTMHLDFDRRTIKKIYSASNGIIGKVKQLAIAEHNIITVEKKMLIANLLTNIINPPLMRLIVCGCLLLIAYIIFNFTQKQYGTIEITSKINKDNLNHLNKISSKEIQANHMDGKHANMVKNSVNHQYLANTNNVYSKIENLPALNHVKTNNLHSKINNLQGLKDININDADNIENFQPLCQIDQIDYAKKPSNLQNINAFKDPLKQEQQLTYEELYQKLYTELQFNLQQQLANLEQKIYQLQQVNNETKQIGSNPVGNNQLNNNKVDEDKAYNNQVNHNLEQNKVAKSSLINKQLNQNNLNSRKLFNRKLISNSNKYQVTEKKINSMQNNINNNMKINNIKLNNKLQLLNSHKNFYILQLMASKNEQSILNLIKKYSTATMQIQYFTGKFKPKDDEWFIAIYGNYLEPNSAIKDIKNLPTDLRKLKPLVRDYNSVKKLINNINNKKNVKD